MNMRIPVVAMALLVGFGVTLVSADGGESSNAGSRLAPFKTLIDNGDYQQAISKLSEALQESPKDADLLNLIAYSHRKLDRYDSALDYYQQALDIEPDHRGANEYLGELYLLLKLPQKAEERLEVLDKECFFGCSEYDELKQAIQQYRQQNPG